MSTFINNIDALRTASNLGYLNDFLKTIKEKDWNKDKLKDKIIKWIDESDYEKGKMMYHFERGEILHPMRVALTGQKNSPAPWDVADLLGKKKTIERINQAIDKL